MNTLEQLIQVFNDNFTAYFRSHVAHVNIMGRNFLSDHKLLEKVYEDLQEQIDSIAEKNSVLVGSAIAQNMGLRVGDKIKIISRELSFFKRA